MNIFEKLSGLAVEHLSPERVLTFRSHYHAARTRLHPVLRLINGSFTPSELRTHLDERITKDVEILMVHSSVNHMAPMFTGSPLDLLQVVLDVCGPHRTLAMPAFYLGDPTIGDVLAAYRRQPHFDVRRTPSQMGIVTELFRRSRGVRQSLHPTHRIAAVGPLAEELTAGHDTAGSTFGQGTPFDFMARRHTLILGIGKPFEVLTQVHHVEDLLGEAFPVPNEVSSVQVTLRDESGRERPYALQVRRFQQRRDMWKLPELMSPDRLQGWSFHRVPFFATLAQHVTEDLLAAARRGRAVFRDAG